MASITKLFTILSLLFLHLGPQLQAQEPVWQLLPCRTGSSADYGSGWCDLDPPLTFKKGDRLRLTVGANASLVLVRLLPAGQSADSSTGVLAKFPVPTDRQLVVELAADALLIGQVSVHGGARPWVWDLGRQNGPATLLKVERLLRSSPKAKPEGQRQR